MMLIYIVSGIVLLIGGFLGNHPWFKLDKINKTNLLNGLLVILALFTGLMAAYYIGYFPQSIAAPFMMFVYSLVAGFFLGYAFRLYNLRSRSDHVLYMHRSFWIDHAPNIAAILIILFGIYRTSVLIDQPVTGIRLTSGLSLIAFGVFGWTFNIVPEFRSKGILFLDRFIPWKHVIAWRWQSEEVIAVEYLYQPGQNLGQVREFLTSVPLEDRQQIETVLKSKMDEFREEREKILLDRKQAD